MDTCLVCGAKKSFIKNVRAKRYSYLVCGYCGGGTLTPRNFAIKKLSKVYESRYFDWGEVKGIKKIIYNIRLHKTYPDWIEGISEKRGTILDVGAGIPDFVMAMKERGWRPHAQELSREQSLKIGKFLGTENVYTGDFEKVSLRKNYYDAVTFWHVLEHVKFPQATIKKTHSVLKDSGNVFIEVPNMESLTWKLFKDKYSLLSVPAHLFYFSEGSLKILLKSKKFKVVETSYPIKYSSAFAWSAVFYIKEKAGINNSLVLAVLFYLLLPFSFLINLLATQFGKSEILRVVARKQSK